LAELSRYSSCGGGHARCALGTPGGRETTARSAFAVLACVVLHAFACHSAPEDRSRQQTPERHSSTEAAPKPLATPPRSAFKAPAPPAEAPLPPADPGDPVFRRYTREAWPSELKLGDDDVCPNLARVATAKDVAAGRAIFTLQGLGRARRVALPTHAPSAEWRVLKRHLVHYGGGHYHFLRTGHVCQAEELMVDGAWRRYLGFVYERGVAVVPADEIDIDLDADCGAPSGIDWWSVEGSIDLGTSDPKLARLSREPDAPYRMPTGPVRIDLSVRSRRGAPQTLPAHWFASGPEGGVPTLPIGFDVLLKWAPYDPRNPDPHYPHYGSGRAGTPDEHGDFSVQARAPVRFARPSGSVTLDTGESTAVGSIDLSELFDLTRPGYYGWELTLDVAAADLPPDPERSMRAYAHSFQIGERPRTLTITELNAELPALGGASEQARVRALIESSLGEPRQVSATEAATVPTLSRIAYGGDLSPMASRAERILASNHEIFPTLRKLDRGLVAAVFERRMLAETSSETVKLILASEAASAGSRRGALYLLEALARTDYHFAHDTRSAIAHALYQFDVDPPACLVELAILALQDDRYATDLEANAPPSPLGGAPLHWASGTQIRLSYVADEQANLTWALANTKAKHALPFLIDRVGRTGCQRGLVGALAGIEGAAAVPTLLRCMKEGLVSESVRQDSITEMVDDPLRHALRGLGKLRAAAAVPPLLERLEFVEVVQALGEIGDPRATEPLEELVSMGGRAFRSNEEILPKRAKKRFVAAQIALVRLTPGARAPRYCRLLEDQSLSEYERRDVAKQMHDSRDPAVIPCLARALQSDPSGSVVNPAIEILAAFPYRTAVEALLAGFDADFEGKSDWKRAYEPEMFRKNIGKSLEKLTGKSFGASKTAWRVWWKTEGRAAFVEGSAR
jgi:HEAT repeat protein